MNPKTLPKRTDYATRKITRCDDPTCTRADCDNAETADEHAAREANRTYREHDTEPQQASQPRKFNTPNNTPNGGWW